MRLSLSSDLIRASIVGCQFNLANKRRQGGKEERNSYLLIDLEVKESEEINMAVGGRKYDQDDQQARRQENPTHRIQRRIGFSQVSGAGHQIGRFYFSRGGRRATCL